MIMNLLPEYTMGLVDDAKNSTVERDNNIINIPIPEDFGKKILANNVKSLIGLRFPTVIDSILPGRPAEKAGFYKNDNIIGINDIPTPSFFEFVNNIQNFKGENVEISVLRNNMNKKINVTVTKDGKIGFATKGMENFFDFKKKEYNIFESFTGGFSHGINVLSVYVKQFKIIFTKEGAKHVGGFGTIGGLFPKTWNWMEFWNTTAFISIILAFVNVLPIPALDGGHVMFVLYEMITRRKPNDKFMEYAQITGMVILFSLLIFANTNDILKLFD